MAKIKHIFGLQAELNSKTALPVTPSANQIIVYDQTVDGEIRLKSLGHSVNDSGTSTSDLWTASKIASEIAAGVGAGQMNNPVADITELKAFECTGLADKSLILVETYGLYRWDENNETTEDTTNWTVVQPGSPNVGTEGRWFRLTALIDGLMILPVSYHENYVVIFDGVGQPKDSGINYQNLMLKITSGDVGDVPVIVSGGSLQGGGYTPAELLTRSNHTGTQAQSTITGLVTDLAGKISKVSSAVSSNLPVFDANDPAGLVDSTVALSSVVINTRRVESGSGLTGGGTLSSDVTLAVSFGGTGSATTVSRSDHTHSDYVAITTQVIAGSGLTGGGALSGNVTLAVSFSGTGSASSAARSDHTHNDLQPREYDVAREYSPTTEKEADTAFDITLSPAAKTESEFVVSCEGMVLEEVDTSQSGVDGFEFINTTTLRIRVPYTVETTETIRIVYKSATT